MLNLILYISLLIGATSSQSYVDSYSGAVRLDVTQFVEPENFWAPSHLSDVKSKLGYQSWYSRNMSPFVKEVAANSSLLNIDDPNNIFETVPWALNLMAPVDINVTEVRRVLDRYVTPGQCRPNVLRILISRLSLLDLEELVNTTISGSVALVASNGWTKSCLKTYATTWLLKRAPYTLSVADIDLFLPAGLNLVPSHLLRGIKAETINHMMTLLCSSTSSYNLGQEQSTMHIRALMEEMVMASARDEAPLPNAIDLCKCLHLLRRPVLEMFTSKFDETKTMLCYRNNSADLDFSGGLTDPTLSSREVEYMSAIFYPREVCRYSRAAMVEWNSMSKIYDKVNRTFYDILNCMSLDKRHSFRATNITVAWDMLSEVTHRKLSINDREDTCLDFRGDYNKGTTMLTLQSIQWLDDAVSCLASFEIRRIPNAYLCLIANLQRFSDPTRHIQREVKWEIARKCGHFLFRDELGVPPAPVVQTPVAPAFGDILLFVPLETFKAAEDSEIRRIFIYIRSLVPEMPLATKFVIAQAVERPYNTSVELNIVKQLCADNFVELLPTTTFIKNDTATCNQFGFLTKAQKIYRAKAIVEQSWEIKVAIEYRNLTWTTLMSEPGLAQLLDALPYNIYSSFVDYEVVDNAARIVQQHPDIDTIRLMLLSDQVISEYKRRAAIKFGEDKFYPYEMVEAELDSLPCQLLIMIRPYDISDVGSDVLACRTLSRKWGSCPALMLKTQSYRDYVCNVFMNCGGSVDADHFVDDLGVYCFCNISNHLLANLTNAQVARMIPVLSELPNCMSQLARISLTAKVVDMYPPKSYITSLKPPGQEALLTELGKLACNLNAAIISERYKKTTFGSQVEALGAECCFNWTASGSPLQRLLMAGVYFNKTVDDLIDVRKMCDRMFNTTAYVMKHGVESDEATSSRKKREVVTSNCSENLPHVVGECAPIESPRVARRRRDVTVEDFSWSCPLLKAMTPDSLFMLTVDDFWEIKHLDFVRCLSFFGESQSGSVELRSAVIRRIKVELSRYFSFCDTDPRILTQLGYNALALSAYNISCLNITDDVVASWGRIESFNQSQLQAIANRYVNLTLADNSTFGSNNMAIMGHALCGLDVAYFSTQRLSDNEFDQIVPAVAELKNCSLQHLVVLKSRATSVNLYGSVRQWAEEHFLQLGIIVAGISQDEIETLSSLQLRWLPENALKQLEFVKKISEDQLKQLLPEQVRYIWPVADERYPINESLSQGQLDALLIAELDDMYAALPGSEKSRANVLFSSVAMVTFSLLFA